jgi:KipI family sensor histidine kinase inhibitor
MRCEPLGDSALRFPRPATSAREIVRLVKAWPGVVDVVVGREDVAVYFERELDVSDAMLDALTADSAHRDGAPAPRTHVLRVVYDGVDLADVARATGLGVDDIIAIHSAGTYVVDTMGFAPGFAYLDGLDPRLAIPRRATPRERIEAGSVAIAGGQTAVYPFASAAGWHVLGRVVDVRMFDERGALLALGDTVRFSR